MVACPCCGRRCRPRGEHSWDWQHVQLWLFGFVVKLYACTCGAHWAGPPRWVKETIR